MTTLQKIVAELERQNRVSRAYGLHWLDLADLTAVVIDGQVNLVALAKAIDDTPTDG